MARAKRTDRAEVRRRYRAELAAQVADAVAEGAATGDPAGDRADDPGERAAASRFGGRPRSGASAAGTPPRAAPAGRAGFVGSFRAAYKIADVRADLRALPVLLRGRSFLIPAGLSLVTFVATLALFGTAAASAATSAGPLTVVVGLLFALFLGPLPIGSIYAAGTLAPQASYLMGGIAAFVGTLGYVALAYVSAPVPTPDTSAPSLGVVLVVIVQYTVFGAVIGAGLGFYRRLLRGMNPTAGQRPPSKAKASARAR